MREALDGLALRDDGWYVDATYGRGGHSAEILAQLGAHGRLLALDKDTQAVAHARERFGAEPRFACAHAGFEGLADVAGPWLGGRALAGILFDLGVSSPQLDQPARGFSFAVDGPLDMRMNTSAGQTAAEWLATVSHGGRAKSRIHPATLAFQAIRIAINDELGALERGLDQALELLGAGGRLVAISFHSLEDRIVKRFMAREARGDEAYAGLPNIPPEARPRLRLVGKLIRPSDDELARNPRARSARLRVAERLEAAA